MAEILYFVRVVLAGICGIAIGYERKNRAKEAGLRTHCIVACAAALMMVISKYGFEDLAYSAVMARGTDPARIAAQVVSGVGFLGAGMIFVQKQTIKGLTTAAGIWATAGIGMAIGAGMYIIGILSTLFVILMQVVLHKNVKLFVRPHFRNIIIKDVTEPNYKREIERYFADLHVIIEDIDISYHQDTKTYNYNIVIEMPAYVDDEEILEKIKYNTTIKSI